MAHLCSNHMGVTFVWIVTYSIKSMTTLYEPNFNVSIREYGSTLYVGFARAVSPTNTNFQLRGQ